MIKIKITRPNGQMEELDITDKFGIMNDSLFKQIKKNTAKAGRGTVNEIITIINKSNIMKLRKEYNNLHNEGGDGYIPDEIEFWKNQHGYKEWIETKSYT